VRLLKFSLLPILIAVIFLLNGASESAEPANPKETEPQSKQSPLQKQEPTSQPKPITIPPPTLSQSPGAQPNQIPTKPEAHEQKPDTTRPTDSAWWFNLFLVIFTGGLLGVGIMQATIYKRQATYMRRGMRVTRQAANAATQAANAAAESTAMMRHQMRPFVTVHFDWPFKPSSKDSRLRYTLKNSGKTWAFIKTIQTLPWEGTDWVDYDAEPLVVPDGKLPTQAVLTEDGTAIQHAVFRGVDPLIADLINNGTRPYLVCVFRFNPATIPSRFRPPIPVQTGHRSGAFRPPLCGSLSRSC
jgi:hypothetical protein